MKTSLRLARLGMIAAGIAALSYSCAGQEEGPPPDADALWNYLQEQNYTAWELFPGTSRQQAGMMPHGALVTLYANDTAQGALGSESLPAGSIIVKENYMPDATLAATTVMYKSPGFDSENNDWFWLQRLADGTVQASGQVQGCNDCHGQMAAARDYVVTLVP